MRAIFISYRRDDAEGQAGRLFDDLTKHFGEDAVFMDVAAIEPGRDFRRVIDDHVASCGVLLAIIGKGWLTSPSEAGVRRLDDPMDFVRLETASALKRDIPVIPVLVHGAMMPRAEDLPEDLKELAFRNGVELTHARWDSDVQILIKALQPYVQIQNKPAQSRKGSAKIIMMAFASFLLVALGGYLWLQISADNTSQGVTAGDEALRITEEEGLQQTQKNEIAAAREEMARVKRETENKMAADEAAAKLAREQAELDARRKEMSENEALQQARDNENAAKREELERVRRDAEEKTASDQAKELSLQKARWRIGNFPPPNAGTVLYTITSNGDPACASYNGGGCLWGQTYDQIDFSKLKPLVCGAAHKARWGVTGYEDPKHWCSLARDQ